MKKITFFIIIIFLIIAVSPKNIYALSENYFINNNGISMTEEEYNMISAYYPDVIINNLTKKEFEHELKYKFKLKKTEEIYIKTNTRYDENGNVLEIKNVQITKENFENTSDIQPLSICNSFYPFGCWETTSKKLNIAIYGSTDPTYAKVLILNQWKQGQFPSVRSNDVIGMWYSSNFTKNKAWGYQLWTTSTGDKYQNSFDENSTRMKLSGPTGGVVAGGVGISMQLPTGDLTQLESQLWVEGTLVGSSLEMRGSYQHAITTVSLTDSKNYTFAPLGLGNVFGFLTDPIWNSYDKMQGVYITW